MTFDCRQKRGTVTLDLQVNNCPAITGLVIPPRAPDGTIAVAVAIAEQDPGDIPNYTWSSGSGRYQVPRGAATTFVCPAGSANGAQPIPGSIQVSDGKCIAEARFELACTGTPASSAPDATPAVSQSALTVAPGVEVETLAYRITGNGIAPREGNIDARGSTGSTMFSLPSGNEYQLVMSGT